MLFPPPGFGRNLLFGGEFDPVIERLCVTRVLPCVSFISKATVRLFQIERDTPVYHSGDLCPIARFGCTWGLNLGASFGIFGVFF